MAAGIPFRSIRVDNRRVVRGCDHEVFGFLVRLGFQIWRLFNLDGEKSLLACVPKYKGVYVI